MLVKSILFVIVLSLTAYLCGCSVKSILKDKIIGAAYTYIIGMMSALLLFGIVQTLCRIFHTKLVIMAIIYAICLLVLIVSGIVASGIDTYLKSAMRQIEIKNEGWLSYVILTAFIILMCAQIFVSITVCGDAIYRDSSTVYEAVQICGEGGFGNAVNAFTGQLEEHFDIMKTMSVMPAWIAMLAFVFDISPLLAANIFIPLMVIPLVYMSYYMFSVTLFAKKSKRYIFLLILGILAFFSNYALYPKQSAWNQLFINCWDPQIIASHVLIPIMWYLSITVVKAHEKEKMSMLSLDKEATDKAYHDAIQSKRQLHTKMHYSDGLMVISCFISLYGAVMCAVTCASVLLYYLVIKGYGGRRDVKGYALLFAPVIIYIVFIIIMSAINKTIYSLDGFWTLYADNLKMMFRNNFKNNIYAAVFVAAILYNYVKRDRSANAIGVYLPVMMIVLGVINPAIHALFGLLCKDCNQILFWYIPVNALIAYAVSDILINAEEARDMTICIIAFMTIVFQFLPKYEYNSVWQYNRDMTKIPEHTRQICRLIEESGLDKKVISIDDGELCETLRLCDPSLELYYYADNKYAYGGDTSMYGYINQDEPYLQGIVQNAKSAGYNYIIVKAGVVDPNWASVLYHIWPAGSTDEYEIYSIGYF